MKLSTLKRVTKHYRKRVEDLIKQSDLQVSNHFSDISSQPISTMVSREQLMELHGFDKKGMHEYVEGMRNLRTYLRLLEKFPEFKHGELTTKDGHFPDITAQGKGGVANYISESKKRLYQ